jgi:hypothetical protein
MEITIDDNIGVGNVAVPAGITFTSYTSASNLTTGDGNLRTSFGVSAGLTLFSGAPFTGNTAVFSTFNYGLSSTPSSSTLWRSTRRRGNGTTRSSLEPNDYLGNIEWRGAQANGGLPSGSRFAKIAPRVDSSYVANTAAQPVGIEFWVTDNTTARTQFFYANGNVQFAGAVNTTGNVNVASGNVILATTGDITAAGRLAYLRTFGSFTSNATQTSNGANTTNYMTLNNTEDANGISIASSTQITVARTGRYNIQFSAQLEKTDSGTDFVEIWLDKNGNAVANSATQLELVGNGAKAVAAWDFNVNAANVNDYFRLGWASPDANIQLTAVPAANTISGVAIPSVIVDINPIGA